MLRVLYIPIIYIYLSLNYLGIDHIYIKKAIHLTLLLLLYSFKQRIKWLNSCLFFLLINTG